MKSQDISNFLLSTFTCTLEGSGAVYWVMIWYGALLKIRFQLKLFSHTNLFQIKL